MRLTTKAVLAGIGALAIAGGAYAASRDSHTLNVVLPDGAVAHIHYTGDVAPRVELAHAPAASPIAFIEANDGLALTPFAEFDRISAEMDRQMAALIQHVASLDALAATNTSGEPRFDVAALQSMPAGTVRYSLVSSSGSNGTCSRSLEMISFGPDKAPKIVEQSSGDCAVQAKPDATIPAVRSKAAEPVKLIPAKADQPAPTAKPRQTI
jgi:hypothetical protein